MNHRFRFRAPRWSEPVLRLLAVMALVGASDARVSAAQVVVQPDTIRVTQRRRQAPRGLTLMWQDSTLAHYRTIIVELPTGVEIRALGGGSVKAEGYCRETTEQSHGEELLVPTARKVVYTLDTLAVAGDVPCALLTIAARVTGESVADPLLRAWGVTTAGDTMPLNGEATPWHHAGLTISPASSSTGDRVLFGLALLCGFALVGWMFRRPFSHPERSRKAGAAR